MAQQIVSNKYIQVNKWGSPTDKGVVTLQTERLDFNNIEQDDIVVKLKYACIHPADINLIKGLYRWAYNVKNNILPSKVGIEGLGEIIQVGSKVQDCKVGQKVLAVSLDFPSSYQQYAIVKSVIQVPENLPDEVGVQFFVNPYTAAGLMNALGLMNGKSDGWLVQNGANSTVGRFIHVLAKIKGVKSIALVRKQDAVKMMKDLGADKVIVIGHINNADDYAKAILDATDGKGAQYAIECVGGDVGGQGMYKAMTQKGHIVTYGALTGKIFSTEGHSNPNNVQSSFFYVVDWTASTSQEYVQQLMDEFYQYYAEGKLKFPIEQIFSIDDFQAAFNLQLNNEKSRTGKALLKMF